MKFYLSNDNLIVFIKKRANSRFTLFSIDLFCFMATSNSFLNSNQPSVKPLTFF